MANVLLRKTLSAVAPALFAPASWMLITLGTRERRGWGATLYTDVLRKANATTRNLWLALAALVALAAVLAARSAGAL
jgi:hypothetical protein